MQVDKLKAATGISFLLVLIDIMSTPRAKCVFYESVLSINKCGDGMSTF